MILQTGMRTDIPAFYSEWFMNRMKEGFVYVRNPYNPVQVTKYRIDPNVVDLIGFCTKNPAPMLPLLERGSSDEQAAMLLDASYWFVTITPYGKEIEPHVPDKEKVMDDFIRLSKLVGADAVAWRYDPIFISETYTLERHVEDFAHMAEKLAGYTHSCVISFLDLYEKTKRNFPEGRRVTREERLFLGKEIIRIGKKYDMTIRPCAEGKELSVYGADCSGCVTQSIYEKAIGGRLVIPKSVKSQRAECACVFGRDIGQYNSCGHLCKYCYANADRELVLRNIRMHDPTSPFLIGKQQADDVIHQAEQRKWRDEQLSIFDL
ncbi:MAG: DUF1848 domain-containing protein [Eubacteriales bacterium]|nr:DUF1848 domain-containing protein [Eubacteriales bacterium]